MHIRDLQLAWGAPGARGGARGGASGGPRRAERYLVMEPVRPAWI
jgi:hypothetical protein